MGDSVIKGKKIRKREKKERNEGTFLQQIWGVLLGRLVYICERRKGEGENSLMERGGKVHKSGKREIAARVLPGY